MVKELIYELNYFNDYKINENINKESACSNNYKRLDNFNK